MFSYLVLVWYLEVPIVLLILSSDVNVIDYLLSLLYFGIRVLIVLYNVLGLFPSYCIVKMIIYSI